MGMRDSDGRCLVRAMVSAREEVVPMYAGAFEYELSDVLLSCAKGEAHS